MSIYLERKKKRNYKLSLAYKIRKLLPFSNKKKLTLFLDLAWIFSRLAHEEGVSIKNDFTNNFLLDKVQQGAKVLDIGCGRGFIIQKLLAKTNQIVGVDYDANAIEIAKGKFVDTPVALYQMNIYEYFEKFDSKVDCAILSHVLEHIDDRAGILQYLSEHVYSLYIEVPDFETNYLNSYRINVGTDLVYSDADHVVEFDRDDLKNLIIESGFTIIDSEFRGGVLKYWCQSEKTGPW